MIKTETLTINNKPFVRTFSDSGYMVERDGIRYSEAIDPAEFDRQYTETDEPIRNEHGYDPNEATDTDYQNALRDMGVSL